MIGAILQDRFRLDSELGRGGMGTVFRAYDLLLERPVAVKVLSGAALSAQARARLLQEARSAAHLNHPNIVSVYDVGEAGGSLFIVMELVEGESLYNRPSKSQDEVIAIARTICAALEHAHNHGVIHRDLKPENVLITPEGQVKLMDFGLARTSGGSRASGEAAIAGTVLYLAPEQALGKPLDGRADLYALGVMLYELFTGQLPFQGDDPLAVIAQHLHAPVPPPRSLQPDLPPALEAILVKLLAKEPDDRFATAAALAQALVALAPPALGRYQPTNNLPVQLSTFVGREREIAEVKRRLAAGRLVTLTGAGGSGKTRLALQVAAQLLDEFPGGVWLVELATLSEAAILPQAVRAALGIPEGGGRPVLELLLEHLRARKLLLILDNCEHLVEACAQLVDYLLRFCPSLRILATSRETLGLPGENAWPVPTLSVPDPAGIAGASGEEMLAALSGSEAVQLFVERAAAIQPTFSLTPRNAAAVSQICSRLDGIPLAIELAAARMKALTAEGIAARLDDRFNLLTQGSRAALPRHQTLRATIDWSYELLSDLERVLFNHLAVFAGGWTLEAAEVVCGGASGSASLGTPALPQESVLDLLARLVDKSLVLAEQGSQGARYQLLETIRQYAWEKLLASGEIEAVQTRHLEHFLSLSEAAEARLRGSEQLGWLARLEDEHDNLRAALEWAAGRASQEAALRLGGSLALFWYFHGHWSEGRDWLVRLLGGTAFHPELETPAGRALAGARTRALYGVAWLSDERGQEDRYYTEGLELCRALGDHWGEAFCLRGLGVWASNQNDNDRAAGLLEASLALFHELQDPWGEALVFFNRGWIELYTNDHGAARASWEQGLALFRQVGDRWGSAVTLDALGYTARLHDEYRHAAELSRESLGLFRELGDKAGMATSLARLASVAIRRDDYRQANSLLEESLALSQEMGYRWDYANTLRTLGLIAVYQGDFERAGRLLNESLAHFEEVGTDYGIALVRLIQGLAASYQGDARAAELIQASLPALRAEDDPNNVAFALSCLGQAAYAQGQVERAAGLLEESLALYGELGEKHNLAQAQVTLGKALTAQAERGNLEKLSQAAGQLRAALALFRELGSRRGTAEALEGLAHLAGEHGQAEHATRLFGAAGALRAAIGAPLPPVERPGFERDLEAARARLGLPEFQAAWEAGQALASGAGEQAIVYALEETVG